MPLYRDSKLKWHAVAGLLCKAILPGCGSAHEHAVLDGQCWFEEVRWEHRLLLISGPEEAVSQQAEACRAARDGMLERELIVVNSSSDPSELVVGDRKDIPEAPTFRSRFEMPKAEFQVVLVGKDGGVKERRSNQFDVEEIFAIIDAMPMRMREIRERK